MPTNDFYTPIAGLSELFITLLTQYFICPRACSLTQDLQIGQLSTPAGVSPLTARCLFRTWSRASHTICGETVHSRLTVSVGWNHAGNQQG